MLVRLFPEGFAFVQGQELEIENVHNGLFVIPLTEAQIDMDTVQVDDNIQIVDTNVATVYKGSNAYQGVLVQHDGQIATLSSRGSRTIIRDYDRIQMSDFIVARSMSGVVPETLSLSYVTTAIHGTVIHRLDVDTGVLTSYLRIQNETENDLDDATIEIVTSRQARQPVSFLRAEAVSMNDAATISQGAGGAIYTLNGTYDIPAGYEMTLPIASFQLDGDIIYVLDAPNGTSNAQYTLHWTSPATLIPGQLQVFRNNVLEARSSLDLVAEGQEMTTDLLRTSAVYARGIISTQRQRQMNGENVTSFITTVQLQGTIFNTLDNEIDLQLRYYVGDATVSSNDGVVEDGYLIWDYMIPANSQQQYAHTFTMTE